MNNTIKSNEAGKASGQINVPIATPLFVSLEEFKNQLQTEPRYKKTQIQVKINKYVLSNSGTN